MRALMSAAALAVAVPAATITGAFIEGAAPDTPSGVGMQGDVAIETACGEAGPLTFAFETAVAASARGFGDMRRPDGLDDPRVGFACAPVADRRAFCDERAVTFPKTAFRAEGLFTATIHVGGSRPADLVDLDLWSAPAAVIGLPASALYLIAGLGGLALLNRQKRR